MISCGTCWHLGTGGSCALRRFSICVSPAIRARCQHPRDRPRTRQIPRDAFAQRPRPSPPRASFVCQALAPTQHARACFELPIVRAVRASHAPLTRRSDPPHRSRRRPSLCRYNKHARRLFLPSSCGAVSTDRDGRVQVRSPRSSGLLRPRARDWGGHEARLGSRVGRVGRYERAAAPHMRVGPRGRALSRVQRPPQWRAARAGGADVTPT